MPTATDPIDDLLGRAIARAEALRRLPVSTYRLQFHAGFTFRDATAILPYLASLGITHVYASPYLAARPGSTHGYDVIDHCRLNPELGTTADYDAFLAGLKANGLSHILDTVPNHVGVATNDNTWWNDVLEHGPASRFAGHFDITWRGNARPEMQDKVLVPTLGKPYGEALEAGELKLVFDAAVGRFTIDYFDRRFPVSPRSYEQILSRGLNKLDTDFDAKLDAAPDVADEPRSIVRAASHLPFHWQTEAAAVEERHRESESIKARLAALVGADERARARVESVVANFNGTPGDAASFDALDELMSCQCFRLADWHVAFDEINYRRFFDVNDLAALSMEKREVFEATHAFILPLLAEGKIAGLRIDHPDGLFDPAQYLRRLQTHFLLAIAERLYRESGGDDWSVVREDLIERLSAFDGVGDGPGRWPLFVSVEKILAMDEPLIADWATHGTSGYDDLVMLNGLFVDPAAEPKFDALWHDITADATRYEELAYRNKRMMLETSLASELNMLAHRLDRLAQRHRLSHDFTLKTLHTVLREMVACFGVYRTYVVGPAVTDLDRRHIRAAADKAKARNPRVIPAAFEYVVKMLTQDYAESSDADDRRRQQTFAGKFQQLTSPVTAKGIEDTTFYQYNRLLTLNEVGGEPAKFGVTPERFHRFMADRQRAWPYALSALSTHDTKRSEDVRARLNVLADLPDKWAACVKGWFDVNAALRQTGGGVTSPAPDEEYLIYQTLIGAWPLDPAAEPDFAERVHAYVLKAIREAKTRTRWGEPNEPHEAGVRAFTAALLDPAKSAAFHKTFAPLQKQVSHFGLLNSLAQTLLKLTAPGVPDTYQGTELWDFSLVDPDNRRPVDYAKRGRLLREIAAADVADLLANKDDGRIKLKITADTLRWRRDHADLFAQGDYRPLTASGEKAAHVFGFTRTFEGQSIAVVVPRMTARLVATADGLPIGHVWADTTIDLPVSRGWRNLFTGDAMALPRAADMFTALPVALLMTDA